MFSILKFPMKWFDDWISHRKPIIKIVDLHPGVVWEFFSVYLRHARMWLSRVLESTLAYSGKGEPGRFGNTYRLKITQLAKKCLFDSENGLFTLMKVPLNCDSPKDCEDSPCSPSKYLDLCAASAQFLSSLHLQFWIYTFQTWRFASRLLLISISFLAVFQQGLGQVRHC